MSDLRFEPTMTRDDRPARAIYQEVLANPARKGFGFGQRAAVVNIDVQQAYTRPDLFPKSAYVTDPDQIDWINRLSDAARARGLPVVWTRVCYKPDGGDAGVWGTRTDTPDSLQNIKFGSERHAFDPRARPHPTLPGQWLPPPFRSGDRAPARRRTAPRRRGPCWRS